MTMLDSVMNGEEITTTAKDRDKFCVRFGDGRMNHVAMPPPFAGRRL
jgi:hypothetical protein